MSFFTQYDPPADVELDQSGETSLTQQQFRDECDINVVLQQYNVQELVSADTVDLRDMAFGNFAAWDSYEDVEASLVLAQEAFATLPASTRARFDNDLATCVAWLDDPQNYAEATDMGIISKVLASGNMFTADPTKSAEFKAGPPAGGPDAAKSHAAQARENA